jgi:hypothetical protein
VKGLRGMAVHQWQGDASIYALYRACGWDSHVKGSATAATTGNASTIADIITFTISEIVLHVEHQKVDLAVHGVFRLGYISL